MNDVSLSQPKSHKKALLWLLLASLLLGFFGTIWAHAGQADSPRGAAFWGEATGKAVFYLLAPLLVLGISKLVARVKKAPAKKVTSAMWIAWALIAFASLMGGSGNA